MSIELYNTNVSNVWKDEWNERKMSSNEWFPLKTLHERIIPYVPKNVSKKFNEFYKEYQSKVPLLNEIICGVPLCPVCRTNTYVIKNGSDKGIRKFICTNLEEHPRRYYNAYTSYNAQQLIYDFTIEGLAFLTTEGGSYEGIAQYFHTSKYLLEFFLTMLVENKQDENIEVSEKLVVIYADFSSARLSTKVSIVMGKVGDRIHHEIVSCENYISAWNFIGHLKKKLKTVEDATIVFVTDGELAMIDPIRKLYPQAIHIRQFHNESMKGIVYIHYPYEGKIYTLRVPWDIVLDEKITPESVKKFRRLRAKKRGTKKKKKVEIDKEVILWEGMVLSPKGKRKKRDESVESRSDTKVMEINKKCEKHEEKKKKIMRPVITSVHDHPKKKIIFKGTSKEAKKSENPLLKFMLSILITIFGGKYITSNKAEAIFGIKSKILSHRTEKGLPKLIGGILKMNRKWANKNEAINYLEQQIPFEKFIKHTYKSSNRKKENKNYENALKESIVSKTTLSIGYIDGHHRKTYRAIHPESLYENPLNGLKYVKAKCELRNATRTFRLDRICSVFDDRSVIRIDV